MICSFKAKVGFLRAMSPCSLRSWWFEAGRTTSLNQIIVTEITLAESRTGTRRRDRLMPLAIIAVTSLSDATPLKAYNVATSTDIGVVIATVKGMESAKN